jgi:drug/metabolite transporter (DMT)-like permease
VTQARTVATAVLVAAGLYLVLALESAGSHRRSTLVSGMCLSLAGLFVAAFLLPTVRRFFELSPPTPGMITTTVLASLLAIGALALAGFAREATGAAPETEA